MAEPKKSFRDRLSGFKLSALIPGRKRVFRFSLGFAIFLVVLAVSAELTSRPTFCTTCHYMDPYYTSWQESVHKEVSCVKCHFPPGIEGTIEGKMAGLVQVVNYLGRSYTRRKPWAEIDDVSCLQCHETPTLEGSIPYKGVVFDHKAHLGELRLGKQLRCTSCHSQVVQGDHITVTETTCFLCHLKGGAGASPEIIAVSQPVPSPSLQAEHALPENLANCKTCHNWASIPEDQMPEFRFDHSEVVEQDMACVQCHSHTVVGDGYVPPDNCNSCHFEAERLEKYDDPELLHRVHIAEHKIECTQCHLRIQHKIQRVSAETALDCTTCHDAAHQEQVFLFTGADDQGFAGEANPMFEAGLNCASCHISHKQMMGMAGVRTANPQSCETCHGEGYGRLLQLWEKTAETKLGKLSQEVIRVESTVRGRRADSLQAALGHVNRAKYAMHLVQVGKAVHNINFSDQLIRSGYEDLNKALVTSGASYRLTGWDTPSVVPGECANCHTGIEDLSPSFQGRTFSHNRHVVREEIACKNCHSNVIEHGQLVLTSQECNSCHHDPAKRDLNNCATCHETAAALYAGTYLDRGEPDLMFDEDVTCADCHVSNRQVTRPTVAVCVDCHDDDYKETGEEWQRDVAALVAEVQTLLQQASAATRAMPAYQQAQTVMGDLERNAAGGLHNYELTMSLLKELRTRLQEAAVRP